MKNKFLTLTIAMLALTHSPVAGAAPIKDPVACEQRIYTQIDEALAPFGARFQSTVIESTSRNGKVQWECGGTFEWDARPEDPAECNKQVKMIRSAFNRALNQTPRADRPHGIRPGNLVCPSATSGNAPTVEGADLNTEQNADTLVRMAQDPTADAATWNAALKALSKFRDWKSQFNIDDLINNAHSENLGTQLNAVYLLGRLGTDAQRATTDLKSLVDSPNGNLRRYAIISVGQVNRGDTTEVDFLRALLNNPDTIKSQAAIESLGAVGPAAEDAIPDLEAIVEDTNRPVRFRQIAKESLKKIESKKRDKKY